jgi:stage II sporulation protein AA (anti-sigma F factor antagonist)
MEFSWRIRPGSPEPTVEVAGELDLESGPYLHEQLRAIMRAHGAHLAIDLTGVTFIDCSGVNALLASHRHARALGGSLRVAGASPCVRRLIGTTGLRQVLGVTPASRGRLSAAWRAPGGMRGVSLPCCCLWPGRGRWLRHSRRALPAGVCAGCRFRPPGRRDRAGRSMSGQLSRLAWRRSCSLGPISSPTSCSGPPTARCGRRSARWPVGPGPTGGSRPAASSS